MGPNMHGTISEAIDRQPEECGMKSTVGTGRLILIMLSNWFGIDGILSSTMYRTMHRMNKSYREPGRPFDRRTPSEQTKANLREALGRLQVALAILTQVQRSDIGTVGIRSCHATTEGP